MTIFWSKHSLEKIKDRNLPKESVSKTIAAPDFLIQGRENKFEAYRKFGKKYLKVVYFNRKNHQIVVTAHYVDRIKNI
ncbi:MAG: hypothetical protein JWM20_315 [Patescibacteria group bacterium]|nr:hypothetical protein [Patescibacteria group bacterium]